MEHQRNRTYKYSFMGQIDTARDFYEARNKTGLPMTDPSQSVSPYVVRIWQWDDAERDYAIEVINAPGHQIFNTYDEAMVCYNTLVEFFPEEITNDFKLELINLHRGKTYLLASKILIPPATDWKL